MRRLFAGLLFGGRLFVGSEFGSGTTGPPVPPLPAVLVPDAYWNIPTGLAYWLPTGSGYSLGNYAMSASGPPVNVWEQELSPILIGMDRPFTFVCAGQNPTLYTGLKFTLVSASGNVVIQTPQIVTSYQNGSGYIYLVIPHAQTANLTPDFTAEWQLVRTDSGSVWPLASGTVDVIQPPAPIP